MESERNPCRRWAPSVLNYPGMLGYGVCGGLCSVLWPEGMGETLALILRCILAQVVSAKSPRERDKTR